MRSYWAPENDSTAVRAAFRAGALAYLIKPFDADELAHRLRGYARYRSLLAAPSIDQVALDDALRAVRSGGRGASGALSQTEEAILAVFEGPDVALFADDVAGLVGIAAPTARRHLARLVTEGRLRMRLQYGATGRPRQEYRLT